MLKFLMKCFLLHSVIYIFSSLVQELGLLTISDDYIRYKIEKCNKLSCLVEISKLIFVYSGANILMIQILSLEVLLEYCLGQCSFILFIISKLPCLYCLSVIIKQYFLTPLQKKKYIADSYYLLLLNNFLKGSFWMNLLMYLTLAPRYFKMLLLVFVNLEEKFNRNLAGLITLVDV